MIKKNIFDDISTRYDSWYENPVGKKIDELEKKAMDEMTKDIHNDGLLLEIGSGTGHWTEYFSRKGFKVMGIDTSQNMLKYAIKKKNLKSEFLLADAQHLPFNDQSFTIVVAITTLEFIANYKIALEEMNRCTKKGGKIIIGALNKYSFMGIKRKIVKNPLFRNAHFFTYLELKNLLSLFGNVKIESSVFFLPSKMLLGLANFIEKLGKRYFRFWGNFFIAIVEKY